MLSFTHFANYPLLLVVCIARRGVALLASTWIIATLSLLITLDSVPSAFSQMCSVNVPHLQGTWRTLPYLMPVNPISATLLQDGKILIVAGSENDASNSWGSASYAVETYRNALWDPTGTNGGSISVQNVYYDVFCSGTAHLPDGRVLVVGGTSTYQFAGDNRASIFDPVSSQFAQTQSMANGRWYATVTGLGDGREVTLSGLDSSGKTNNTVEIYNPATPAAGWSSPVTAPFSPPLFPRMFLLPNGKVFFTGQGSSTGIANAWILDPSSVTWTMSASTTMDRQYGSSVLLPLLPPTYTPRVMNFGGGSPATSSTEIIDLSATSPNWTPGPSMSAARIQMNAVILPNGKILAEGGSANNEVPDTPGKTADMYDPVANIMTSAGTASYSRLYHSTAVLLPDATVASLGSNPPPRGGYEPAIEVYTPPYLFDSNDNLVTSRPVITGVSPAVLGYNQQFSVTYTSVSPISSAVLIRPASTTHAFDMDQRLIGLCGTSPQPVCTGSGTLTLTSPPNGNIAPPGYYMLFVLDNTGVPSVAKFIQLTRYTTTPPAGTITSPTSDVWVNAGTPVAFSGSSSSSGSQYSWVFPGGSPATSTSQSPGNITFNTAGVYVTSFTVTDSSGNSDPSPPARTIWAMPTTADYDLTVTPAAVTVTPGQSAMFTVNVQPSNGFNGSVNLSVGSENGFPAGVSSAGFSPATINGSGSATLTINTTTAAVPFALSLTITGTSGSLRHGASTTLLVNMPPPAGLTVTSTSSGQVSLSWSAVTSATGYHLKRALVSGGPYIAIACPTSTSYTDTGLTNGTTYYYVISADYIGGPVAGGESTDSNQVSATPGTSPDFTLSASPATNTVAQGANASYTITVAAQNGFTGSVGLSLNTSALPAGANATFTPATITGGAGTSNLVITTAATTPSGSYPLTVTGISGSLTHTTAVTLVVSGTGGTLSGALTTASGAQNLTSLGTADWAHWGVTNAASFDHKATGGGQISNYSPVGTGTVFQYGDNPVGFSWSDGTPTASATNTTTGIYVSGQGNGFKITAPADTTQRTLTVYVGLWTAQGKIVAHLSDGSAPDYTDSTLNNAGGTTTGVYTLSYKAGSSGQNLTVTYTQANNTGGNVTLQAATLASTTADFTLSASPATNTVAQGANASYTITVAAQNGFTGSVGLSLNTSALPAGANATFTPATITGGAGTSNLVITTAATTPSGSYPLTVTGISGSLTHTTAVTLVVSGTGGTLSGALTTASGAQNLTSLGTADWAHWGVTNAASFDHKATGGGQISNYSPVGTGTVFQYGDNPVGFSWSDGTPTASATNTTTGIYVSGQGNGFKITAPADTTQRTLTVYVGLWTAQGKIVAHLSDGSAPDYTDSTLNNAGGTTTGVYTLSYKAGSSGQNLTVTYTQANNTGGNVTLQAATLTQP